MYKVLLLVGIVFSSIGFCPVTVNGQELSNYSATATQNMVATVHPLATEAALKAFDQGGNAVDAAIAAALTLGVVDGFNSGIGGGCFVLIRRPDGSFHALDGRDMASLAATRDMYLRDGKPNGELSQDGPLAVAVPGALAGYEHAVREFGKVPFAKLISDAAEIAEEGFEVDGDMAGTIRSNQTQLSKYKGNLGNLLKPDGTVPGVGEKLRQPDLANTYRKIAESGIDWFYCGPFAKSCGEWFRDNGGILTEADFAAYRTMVREPLISEYRGYQIVGFPPPSSGGVHVAQILNILENFPLAEIHERDPVQFHHIVAEAMKLAFADRAYWLGDPDFASVPRGLVDKEYGRQLAARIDLTQAISVAGHGDPTSFDPKYFGKHTTHIAAADREGNWVAITTTVNTSFGSKVVVPGTGVILNNQMDDFAIAPGTPNAFGLVGADANAIAPGKRPLSSMSPTIVCKNGEPVFTVGAAGGPRIITQVVWAIVRYIDLKTGAADAVALPRLHQQWSPDVLYCEQNFDLAIREKLAALGHKIQVTSGAGICQAISFDAKTGLFTGVHDPRTNGKASGR